MGAGAAGGGEALNSPRCVVVIPSPAVAAAAAAIHQAVSFPGLRTELSSCFSHNCRQS